MMSEVKWIKIATNIFDDEKIKLIEILPEADGIIVIWFKLLCLAGKQNNNGIFMMNDKIAYTDEMLSTIFRKPLPLIRSALKTFEDFKMIEIINNVITIPNWEKHQNIDGLEKIREQGKLRAAKHREKQKQLVNTESNVTVTLRNALDIDIEKDKDINNLLPHTHVREEEEFKPTLNEIIQFCKDNNFKINPNDFYNYYNSLNWKINGQPIQNWKALLRTCEFNPKNNNNTSSTSTNTKKLDDPEWLQEYVANFEDNVQNL